jgi:short-subunit dehydrogenase
MAKNNVILIGASQGIGRALALEFAAHRYNLALLSRNIEAIRKLSEELADKAIRCTFKQCDVTDYEQVEQGINYSKEFLGTIDIAVINSGIDRSEWMGSFSSARFKEIIQTNTFGIAHALEFLIPIMKQQGYGKIAGVSTLADVRGYMGSSAYNASKAAASLLLESARVELKKNNIRVITIRPGFVKTAMTDKNDFPMPFMISAQKAARIIRRGIEKNRSIVQFPFITANATRLIRIMPNWLYDRIMRIARPAKK